MSFQHKTQVLINKTLSLNLKPMFMTNNLWFNTVNLSFDIAKHCVLTLKLVF